MKRLLAIICIATSAWAADAPKAQQAYAEGRAAVARGDHERAIESFERAIALNPKSAAYHYQLGAAYGMWLTSAGMFAAMSTGQKVKAEFERAVELDPGFLPARFALLEIYAGAPAMFGGSEPAAIEQANEIRKRDRLEGHRAFARIHVAAKKLDLARGEYDAMIKESPRSARAHYLFGLHLLATEKNYSAAAAEFETAVKIAPAYMPAYFRIGHTAAVSATNFARGEEALKKYIAYKPVEEEPATSRAWFWLGTIYEKQGRKADAKASYAASLKLNPTASDVKDALKRVE